MEKARLCARCGKCLSACPIYQVSGRETLSPRGRVALFEAHLLRGDPLWRCLLCASCEKACPNKVPVLDFIFEGRKAHPQALSHLLPFGRVGLSLIKETFRQKKTLPAKGDLVLFLGCGADFLYPETTLRFHNYLERTAYSLALPSEIDCCGLPHLALGDQTGFLALAQKNLHALAGAQKIVTLCASCLYTLTELYPRYLQKSPYASLAKEIAERCLEAGTFLLEEGLVPYRKMEGIVFQVPCHLRKNHYKWWHDLDFMVYEGCCGEGGLFGWRFPREAGLIRRKIQKILEKARARVLVTACTSCWQALRRHYPLPVKMLPEVLIVTEF